jgi:solute carrier family 25 folate transporter 32
MSYNRSPTSTPTSIQSQYASAADPPPILRSFNTMPSPAPDTSFISRLQIYSTQIPEGYIAPICGAGAGLASGIVTCPLDVIKTKLQAQGGFVIRRPGQFTNSTQAYKGMVGTARVIWAEEGLRGMYRGLGPLLMGYLPTWAVYLSVYDRTRGYYYDQCGECCHPLWGIRSVTETFL